MPVLERVRASQLKAFTQKRYEFGQVHVAPKDHIVR